MAVDLSVFDRLKTKADYDRAEEEFQVKKAIAFHSQQGNAPAALQIADAYAQARASGDTQRMNDIAMAAKSFDKGVIVGADGSAGVMGGYAPAVAGIEGAKSGAKELAQKQVDLSYNPAIAGRESDARLQSEGTYKPAIEEDIAARKAGVELTTKPRIEAASTIAKAGADKALELTNAQASLPQLEATAKRLSDLGKVATYTKTGRMLDAGMTEMGMDPRESAVARTAYTALVDNQVLPLLRQTFGAAFTQKEGESLKVTLGDPNLSPAQKDAVLAEFIDQKKQTLQSMGRDVGAINANNPGLNLPGANALPGMEDPSSPKPPISKSDALNELRRRGKI